jgi:WD40 repeat protein
VHRVAADQKYLDAVFFAPDGKTLATVGWWDIRFWDVVTGRETGRTNGGGRSFGPAIAFSPDGKTLAASRKAPLRQSAVPAHSQKTRCQATGFRHVGR